MKRLRRGFTLLELLVAISILAMVSVLIYGAFSAMQRSRAGLERVQERYREGRMAMQRISRDLESSYLSQHLPVDARLAVQKTSFIGKRGSPADRLDFNTFSNTRRDRNAHESDQAEVSYFGSDNPDKSGTLDLARRVSTHPDLDPQHGGRVEVLATDIDLFQLEYLDPQSGMWNEAWDSTQVTGQPNRIPLQVRITLIMNAGGRSREGSGRNRIRFMTVVMLPIQQPLNFANL